jgi:DNA polymerase III epsilon subunit-like protein
LVNKKYIYKYFTRNYRDLKVAVQFFNDVCFRYKGKERFSEYNLKYLCEELKIDYGNHDSMGDCLSTLQAYNRLIDCTELLFQQ